MNGCSSSALVVANTLARFDDYELITNQAYGPDEANQLDIYKPTQTRPKGTVIFFYGGCWGACTTYSRANYRFLAQALTAQGYIVVIPDYRLYPKVLFPQIMQDGAAIVSWVSNNIDRFGGKSEQMFLMGHSAGGHIAAMLAINEQYLGDDLHKNIRGYIGLASPYDFIFDQPYMEKLFAEIPYEQSQPSHFIDGSEPPLLLLYGKDDKTVYMRNIVKMMKAVKQKNGNAEPHIYNGMNHTDILAAFSIPYRDNYNVVRDISAFLDKHSGSVPASKP
jgi:acetyl esterase/lipase